VTLRGEIDQHRLDPQPHPNWNVEIPPTQIVTITQLIQGQIPVIPAKGTAKPKGVVRGEAASDGRSQDYSSQDHKHALVLGPDLESIAALTETGWVRRNEHGIWSAREGTSAVGNLMTEHDPKTGLVRHVRQTFWKGVLTNLDIGPWHPFQEQLAAGTIAPAPSAGEPAPVGAIIFHRASDALTYDADADNVLLAPKIMADLLVESDTAATPAFVSVPANVGQTWYGCILPIRFRNNRASDTPAQWVVQLHDATGVPDAHFVCMALTNKHNAETPWLIELPFAITSDDDAACMGYGGEMVVWLFLGLGINSDEQATEPTRTAWTIQVDAWLV